MSLYFDPIVSKYGKAILDLVENHVERTGVSYSKIRSAENIKEIWARNTLIVALSKTGLSLKSIHTIAGCTQDYAQRVLDWRRKEEQRMKTQSWEMRA